MQIALLAGTRDNEGKCDHIRGQIVERGHHDDLHIHQQVQHHGDQDGWEWRGQHRSLRKDLNFTRVIWIHAKLRKYRSKPHPSFLCTHLLPRKKNPRNCKVYMSNLSDVFLSSVINEKAFAETLKNPDQRGNLHRTGVCENWFHFLPRAAFWFSASLSLRFDQVNRVNRQISVSFFSVFSIVHERKITHDTMASWDYRDVVKNIGGKEIYALIFR